jgi:hypothetical protein
MPREQVVHAQSFIAVNPTVKQHGFDPLGRKITWACVHGVASRTIGDEYLHDLVRPDQVNHGPATEGFGDHVRGLIAEGLKGGFRLDSR